MRVPKELEAVDPRRNVAAKTSSFPRLGVSLKFLRSIADDPCLRTPCIELSYIADGTLVEPLSRAAISDFAIGDLRSLARSYRVFSFMDGADEFGRYDGTVPLTRAEILTALETPPHTTSQVSELIVRPRTMQLKCSYAEMLRPSEDVGLPTCFLSHAWRYDFASLVDAVEQHFAPLSAKDRAELFFWNDIFVENQNTASSKPPGYFFTAFKDAVGAIGSTLLVLDPWRTPIPLSRSWCIWEIFSTLTTGAELNIALPSVSRRDFERALVDSAVGGGFASILSALSTIDSERARAFDVRDKAEIDATIVAELGGFHLVNELISNRMRAWLLSAGDACLDRLRKEEGDDAADASALMSNLTVLFGVLSVKGATSGRMPSAGGDGDAKATRQEKDSRAALKVITTQLVAAKSADEKCATSSNGDASEVYTRATYQLLLEQSVRSSNVARVIVSSAATVATGATAYADRLAEALALDVAATQATFDVVTWQVRTTGGVDPTVFAHHLLNVSNEGVANFRIENFERAEGLLRQAIKGSMQQLSLLPTHGDEGVETQRPRANLAAVLMKRPLKEGQCPGKHTLAEFEAPTGTYCCDACGGGQPANATLFGCRVCDYDLCLSCARPLAEAEALLRKALRVRREKLGESHNATLGTLSNLAVLLRHRAALRCEARMLLPLAPETRTTPPPKLPPQVPPPRAAHGQQWSVDETAMLREAIELYRSATRGFRKTLGVASTRAIDAAAKLAHALVLLGQRDEARASIERWVLAGTVCCRECLALSAEEARDRRSKEEGAAVLSSACECLLPHAAVQETLRCALLLARECDGDDGFPRPPTQRVARANVETAMMMCERVVAVCGHSASARHRREAGDAEAERLELLERAKVWVS